MNEALTTQQIADWLQGNAAIPLEVSAADEREVRLSVAGSFPMSMALGDGVVTVSGGRELPAALQNVLDGRQLKDAAVSATRSSPRPMIADAVSAGGKQATSLRAPLFLDGLTRNELAAVVWAVWKAQELIEIHIAGIKDFAALSAKVQQTAAAEAEAMPVTASEPPAQQREMATPAPQPEPVSAVEEAPGAPEPAVVPASVAQAPSAGERLFCWNCGRETKPGTRFCNGCGSSLET